MHRESLGSHLSEATHHEAHSKSTNVFISRRKRNSERLLTLTVTWFGFSFWQKGSCFKNLSGLRGCLGNEVVRILRKPACQWQALLSGK